MHKITLENSEKYSYPCPPTQLQENGIVFSTEYFPPDWIDKTYSPAMVNIQPGLPNNRDF